MALNVASLLDGASLAQGTLDKALAGMNKVLNIKQVSLESSEKCSVMVTIGARSYLFSTQATGILQVSAVGGGEESVKALAKCNARLVLDPVAFNNEVGNLGEAWEEALRERRKMVIEGDETTYVMLHNALVPHVSSLQAATPAVSGVKQENSVALDMWKGLEPPTLQVANLSPDASQPPLDQMRGWLMFSAVSSMFGNMGQSNYVASNQFMDALTFSARQCRFHEFEALTMMWGTVGHMGMRWKAFGSADSIYQDENIVMMPSEAATVLKTIFEGACPEWFVANKFDEFTTTAFRNGGWPANPDPWGYKKGKGGGTDVHDEGDIPEPLQPAQKPDAPRPGKNPHEGMRVRLHRLEKAAEMNGNKGTLVEEMEDGNWVVRLDKGLGDKILKVSNMMTLSGAQVQVA